MRDTVKEDGLGTSVMTHAVVPLSPLRLAASKTDLASPLRIVKLLPALRLISCSAAGGARGPFGGEVYSPPRLFAHVRWALSAHLYSRGVPFPIRGEGICPCTVALCSYVR